MNTDKLMQEADEVILSIARHDGPFPATDEIGVGIAQVCALLAIANELKRLNDRKDSEAVGQEDLERFMNGILNSGG